MPFRDQPGLIDIDFGVKRVADRSTGELSIRFKLREKIQMNLLESHRMLPKKIGEFSTDVLQIDPQPESPWVDPTNAVRPLRGGLQIFAERYLGSDHYGTLGCIFNVNGHFLALTNYHVLYGSLSEETVMRDLVGRERVFQNNGNPASKSIGLCFQAFDMLTDYATVEIDPRVDRIPEINGFRGHTDPILIAPVSRLKIGVTKVKKSGVTTGITFGLVDGRSLLYPGKFTIIPDPKAPEGPISNPGDSGSAWIINEVTEQARLAVLHSGRESPGTAYGHAFQVILNHIESHSL
ncbi:hypothetical protein DBR43_31105 [Pedobacter sp. KBW06]|nr:hypothetical protein DBR43_31105 [Pedobacter sp. KBW06]